MAPYTIQITKDGAGYLAEVKGYDYLYARGETPEQAKASLSDVVEMSMDYHLEQVEQERNIKKTLFNTPASYAI